MKFYKYIFILLLLLFSNNLFGQTTTVKVADTNGIIYSSKGGVPTQSDCSTITFGGCIDSDDGKFYVWNGSAVIENTSGFTVTDITGQTDDTTPATTATAVLAQGGSLIESTLAQIGTSIGFVDWTADQGVTNIHAGNYTDTNTTYTASGTLLNLTGTAFSVNEGTLTNGKYCTYVTGTGLVCNSDSGAVTYPGAGIAVSTGSAWGESITNNSANWNTAYGWGDHTSAGYLTAEVDGSTSNEIQDLSLAGDTLSLSEDATTVDLSGYYNSLADLQGSVTNDFHNLGGTDANTTYVSSDFNHDDLTGFVANEHIDWTADQGATNIHSGNVDTIGALITGYSSGAGTVAATDTILQAINKLNGNNDLKLNIANPAMTGDATLTDATPTLILNDSDNSAGTAGTYANSSGGANDIIWSFGVEDSTGASTEYFQIDGVTETIDFLKPLTLANTGVIRPAASTDGHTFIIQAYGTDGSNNPELKNVITCTNDTAATANNLPECSIDNVDLSLPVLSVLTIPQSDDPDVSATGQISLDTDGWLRVYNDTRQNAIRLYDTIQVVVYKPNDMDDAQRDAFGPIFTNTSGMSFIVTDWNATSTSDDTTLNIEEIDSDGQNNTTVDAVEIATNGTGIYTASDSTITGATIETGHRILLDFDDTDAPAMVTITINGYYNADVN